LFVNEFRGKYGAKAICQFLKISESGYYRWLRNQGKLSARRLLLVRIQGILAEHPDNQNYGVRRMQTALAHRGTHVSIRTVYRTMSEAGLIHRHRRPHGITKADTATQDRENLLKRDFTAAAPLKKLLTDITEVQCADGKLYVSPILDCYNGEIVALEMRDNMKKELCIDTIKQLREKYGRLEGTILHSDRGCQYTSYAFRRTLVTAGMIQSLSGTAHCYDNARMESFFATLKKEKLYQIPTYKMKREEVKTVIFRYIFGYYNTQRINSFNEGGLPPVALRSSTDPAHHAA
jgi:transposase InsO family protein